VRPERRIALVSVGAALVLIALKLATGLTSGSLALLSEAAHSGTDLAAALLTFFAVGVAVRPADRSHPYGHGKAEHLAALTEAAFLLVVSVVIAVAAIGRLARDDPPELDLAWWVFAALGAVVAIDASRAAVSWRAARRFDNAALATNALHFASDLGGTLAVLAGLVAARAGYAAGDSWAALFVSVLVLVGAGSLARQNVDVLMDRSPAAAQATVRRVIESLEPPVELRRLRMRRAAGRHFADVVIGIAPAAGVGQGHAAADAVERAVEEAVPGTDVVVHVEPGERDAALRERVHAAALGVPRVREIHNVAVLRADGRLEVSLHLKLPGSLPLGEAHEIATEVEHAIRNDLPDVDIVHTHVEPLGEETAGTALVAEGSEPDRHAIERLVSAIAGRPPRDLRLYRTDAGLVAFLTLALESERALADAHARASEIEERIRAEHPEVADVVIHTEP
jgi:cation diffusion facilitator family transporter